MSTLALVLISSLAADVAAIHGKGRFAQTPGGRIYYETEGSGPPVIVSHGGPGSHHGRYHPWFSALARTHTVVYMDNPGCGRSDDRKDKQYSLHRDAEAIEAVRRAIGADSVHLIGVSYGSLPALEYTLSHPGRVARLVLLAGQLGETHWKRNIEEAKHIMQVQYPELWAQFLALRARGVPSLAPEAQEIIGKLEGELFWANRLEVPAMTRFPGERGLNTDVYRAIVGDDPEWEVTGSLRGYDPRPRMKSLRVPTLVVTGRYDRVSTPQMAYEVRDALPPGVATVRILERSGHRPWMEEPEPFFKALAEFLR
jgi:proline iminopeptidase